MQERYKKREKENERETERSVSVFVHFLLCFQGLNGRNALAVYTTNEEFH